MTNRRRQSAPTETATRADSDLTDFDQLMRSLLVERYGTAVVTERLRPGERPPPGTDGNPQDVNVDIPPQQPSPRRTA